MVEIGTDREKFERLDRINELFSYCVIALGFALLHLPGTIDVSKSKLYVLAFAVFAAIVVWHRVIPKKYTGLIKIFAEAMIGLLGISLVVNLTGGLQSYFVFLYFFPILSSTVFMPFRAALVIALTASFLIINQTFGYFGTNEFIGMLSVATLPIWAIWLLAAYGIFLRDEISVMKKREEEIRLEEIREVDKLKDEFIFIISHELRSPITVIRGYLELLVSDSVGKISGKVRKILVKAFVTSNELSNLVSLLLEVARLETGKIHFYIQEVLVGSVLDKVALDLERELKEKNLDLKVNLEDDLMVKIDSERLEEIFTIILGNSVSYTPEFGRIEVSAEKEADYVKVKVTDTGVGMEEGKRNHLFEKFYTDRVGTSDKTIKGINIGLYVVKQLLLKMGGSVSVDSKLGEGTTFTVKLPIAKSDVS